MQGDVYTSFLERLNRRHEANKKEDEMKITKRQLRRIIKEAMRQVGPTVPQEMMDRINALEDAAREDHLFDIVDAIESGASDYTLDMLKNNLLDAEYTQNDPEYARKKKAYKENPEFFN